MIKIPGGIGAEYEDPRIAEAVVTDLRIAHVDKAGRPLVEFEVSQEEGLKIAGRIGDLPISGVVEPGARVIYKVAG